MTIFGWDMSHYDQSSIGNAISQGIKFITHKAGGDATDAELDDWWNSVKNLGQDKCLLGAYWVLLPGSPAARADSFIARLDAACSGWRNRPFILQVDCEEWNSDPSTVPSKSDIKAFCDRLVAKMPKLRPIVYAPKWVYGNSLSGLGYPLWASQYVTGSGGFQSLYPGDGSSKWNSYSGNIPLVLQYSSSANIGGQTTCDANAFRGTLQELTALLAPGWSEADMPLTNDDVKTILSYDPNNGDGVPNPFSDSDTNPTMSVRTALYNSVLIPKQVHDQITGLTSVINTMAATVSSLAASGGVDVNALATAVSAAVVPAVISGLQANGAVSLTQEQVEAASEAAVRTVLGTLDN